ncbi:MAG: Dihydrolipoyllysine-residue succinyltransferase component of 2-oxoglutarate dehydrogenase complex [Chlamydiae bacterium]|nr:Dihydrolipoyllysine-residue succinyltransferase component of 2-oxoglutarate dehydrogenase complex [Chlamydiota bacterium]
MKMEIKVPSAGESVAEATVSQILKESGSSVKTDDEIIEFETEKVNQVIYSPGDGVLELTVKVDDVVKVGQVIGHVDTEGVAAAAPSPPPKEEEEKEVTPAPPVKAEEGPPVRIMPEEHVQELEKPKEAPVPSPPPTLPKTKTEEGTVTRRRMSGLRKTIAERLVAAKNQTAMLTTFNEVDMTQIMEIRVREQENFMKRNGVKLGFMSFFVKAVVAALKEFPDVNSFLDGDEIVTFHIYDVCIAVSTEKGLMVPVIRGCDEKSFGEIENDIAVFAKKAREGKISIDDMRGGSFTITNGGVFGSMLSTPILNPPQSGILGMHTIVKRPLVSGDQIVIRPIMYLALSYDHRIVDGREAIQFLVHLKNNLEEPTRMLIDL